MEMTAEQRIAMRKTPSCVDLDQLDGTWDHVVYRVEHPITLVIEGHDSYTKREARCCQKWLKKYAPNSEYANAQIT